MMIDTLMAGVGLGSYAVGLVRQVFAMETLYRLSVIYPLLALGLAVVALLGRRLKPSRASPVGVQRLPGAGGVG